MRYFQQQVPLCTTGVHDQLEESIFRDIKESLGYEIQNLLK